MLRWGRVVFPFSALILLAAPARAVAQLSDYPPHQSLMNCRDAGPDGAFFPGEAGACTALRLTPNETYHLDFQQSPPVRIASGATNNVGVVRFDFRIPTAARSGAAQLVARPADGTGLVASATIQIVGGRAAAGAGLPNTGIDLSAYAGFALVSLFLGLLMLAYSRWKGGPVRRLHARLAYDQRTRRLPGEIATLRTSFFDEFSIVEDEVVSKPARALQQVGPVTVRPSRRGQ